MTVVVVAEKPSVARDLARVLGATQRGDGTISGNGYVVTWAIGHLVGLAQPEGIRAEWKRWSRATLPMLPQEWPLQILEGTKAQFGVVSKALSAKDVTGVICATDAGREGELIFRLIYEAAGCKKPVKRLWISSLTDGAIRDGFAKLRPSSDFDALADAAVGRSRADWLVGMNLSRAYGIAMDSPLSVGRVQTPTLALLVERELAIRDFVPEDYLEVIATFSPREEASYRGTWHREGKSERSRSGGTPDKPGPQRSEDLGQGGATRQNEFPRRLKPDGVEAGEIVARAKSGTAKIASITSKQKKMPPPLLYDLTELQRHLNRLYGFSAQKALELAQSLYEKHKAISYPRTDSRHLSTEVAGTLGPIVRAIRAPYEPNVAPGTGERPLSKRFVDDAQVSDHHAIIPTAVVPQGLSPDEQKVYSLVCRRLLQAWHDDFTWAATEVITEITNPGVVDTYKSHGTAIEQQGWKVLDVGGVKPPKEKDAPEEEEGLLPSGLEKDQPQQVLDAKSVQKKTRPPPRLTDATLLTAMETAGKTLDERELSDAMKENGLGTPATRANIIETLLNREYVRREGKTLVATDKGIGLIQVVDAEVKSPAMTGAWEARLQRIAKKQGELGAFMRGIEEYVTAVVGRVWQQDLPRAPNDSLSLRERVGVRVNPSSISSPRPSAPMMHPAAQLPRAVVSNPHPNPLPKGEGGSLASLLKSAFNFATYRPHQQAACEAAAAGEDVLLVMPTGAGKSLCYQLPGLARGGTTLVVSPLIALMEDQVAGLQAKGLRAERIHSGRGRLESRRVCNEYLAGNLDYLFIAPERLGVPNFPELLAKRTPSLIAIDEAHCISQWGHDFRPDYRLLGARLPMLRPAPVMALTATATPIVQADIVKQLGLKNARQLIHGFRRHNLAIEVLEVTPNERVARAQQFLSAPERLPAIVYAPTRKTAEAAAEALGEHLRVAPYHAGLSPEVRNTTQTAFLSGKLDVVVATIAFGMGVDKANVRTVLHLALPGSVEAYYQEIGRAGRDGLPSRAVLMHHFVDRKTHEFFLERDYPEEAVLKKLSRALSDVPQDADTVRRKARIAMDDFEKALEKLWIHGGVKGVTEDQLTKGHDEWPKPYAEQRRLREEQLALAARFAESHRCRMVSLVRHFGDQADSGKPCGTCDVCAPTSCIGARFEPPTASEVTILSELLARLRASPGQANGRLCRELLGEAPEARPRFERLVSGLVRAGQVRVEDDVFEKDGRKIQFHRLYLVGRGTLEYVRLPMELPPVKTKGAPAFSKKQRRRRGTKRESRQPAVELPESALVTKLRTWRLEEAKRRRVPAFRVLTNRALVAVAEARPQSVQALRGLAGVGPKVVQDFGAQIVALCR